MICSLASENPDISPQIGKGLTLLDNSEEIESLKLNEFNDANEDVVDDFDDFIEGDIMNNDFFDCDSIDDNSVGTHDNDNDYNANINIKEKRMIVFLF